MEFLSGSDQQADLQLLPFEIEATLAHAKVLANLGILDQDELAGVSDSLEKLSVKLEAGEVTELEAEDVHSFVELWLTTELGETGKKIHTFRSRNDLIAMDIRLYMLKQLEVVGAAVEGLVAKLDKKAVELGDMAVQGYTHLQPAMPFTAGGYLQATSESLSDDLSLAEGLKKVVGKSTLGSGAGFGFPVELPKKKYAEELGLSNHVRNPLYAVTSRPKVEKLYLHWLSCLADSLEKFASTLVFLAHEGAFQLPGWCTTGSSIMPQKSNPDVLEVMRGRTKLIKGCHAAAGQLDANLAPGYFRDFQEGKGALFGCTETMLEMLEVATKLVPDLQAKEHVEPQTYATYEAIELALDGVPWREAYHRVAGKVKEGAKPASRFKSPKLGP